MDPSDHKDYAYKNEISLSIGDDTVDSNRSTPSTITPTTVPTPSPRQNITDDTKPLTQSTDSMKTPEGIDNKAFDKSEASSAKPLSSFGNGHSNGLNDTNANGANKNGQLNEKKLAEAVNLELININNNMKKSSTTNGKHSSDLPMKKDGDVEMGTTKDDSYDEYFVPVNEHRKYMRGEKLYVTKDKRAKTKKNKLCWILCLGALAAVIILIILAASGAFKSEDPTPVGARQLNGSKGNDTVNVAGVFGAKSSETTTKLPDSTTTTAILETTTTEMIPIMETTKASPSDEEIIYVPNSLEGQITLSNAEYSTEYNDPKSPIYKKMIKDLETEIKNALSQNGNEEFFVKIIGLKSGSVVVDYRISWKNPESQLTSEEMDTRIKNHLQKNNQQFMNRYHVNVNTVRTARVPDKCTDIKSVCTEGCEFNTEKVDFECTCKNGFDEDFNECNHDGDSVFDSDSSSEPESASEPEPAGDDSDYHGYPHHESTSEPSSEPESSSEPSSEPEATSEPSSEPETVSEPDTSGGDSDYYGHQHHESTSEPSSEPESSSEPSSKLEITSEPSSEPDASSAEPEPKIEKEVIIYNHDHHKESTSEPSSGQYREDTHNENIFGEEIEAVHESTSEPSSEPSSAAEPSSEPSSTAEPASEPSSSAEPSSEHASIAATPETSSSAEPASEPSASSEPSSEPSSTAEPSSEPSASEPSATSEPSSEPSSSAEPSSEPSSTAEPASAPSSSAEPSSEHASIAATPEPSSSAEPASEPSASSEPSSEPSSTAEPTSEPSASEPSATSEPSSEPSSSAEPSSEPSSTSEPSSEPSSTSEPSSEPSSSAEPTKESSSTTEQISERSKIIEKKFKLLEQEEEVSNKPVVEELDDTQPPTEKYFTSSHGREFHKNDLNIFDMNSTTQSSSNTTIYSTVSPVKVWQENSTITDHDMSPFLPAAEISQQKQEEKSYSVTENIADIPHVQSPFLPELENNETLHHILNGAHGMVTDESEEVKNTTTKNADMDVVPIILTSTVENDTKMSKEKNTSEILMSSKEVQNAASESTTESESSTSTQVTPISSTTEETLESETDPEATNLFGESEETVHEEIKSSKIEESVSSTANVTENQELTTPETHIQVLLKTEISTELPDTTSTTEHVLTSSQTPITEQIKTDSTTLLPETSSILRTEEQSTTKAHTETTESSKTLFEDMFKPIEEKPIDDNENILSVIPLSKTADKQTEIPTTTDASLSTNENEITEKTETTGNFLEQTTFPSNNLNSDESSLNNRNGKVLNDSNDIKEIQQIVVTVESTTKPEVFAETPVAISPNSCSDNEFKCTITNECISKAKICDGKSQCADSSDEWNCFNIINNTNILQVKQEDKYFKVCASGWTKELLDKMCQKMGYAATIDWKSNTDAITKDEKYLSVKNNQSAILEGFEFSESCNGGLLELHCEEYVCGSNFSSTADSGEFSSIALVVNPESTQRCTASIISPLWALTSASCVSKMNQNWILIAGSTDLNMSKISNSSIVSLIRNIVTYPENDFALLELKVVLPFTNQIYSACIDERIKTTNECLTTGWLTKTKDNSFERYEKIATVERNCTSKADALCVTLQNRPLSECYNDKGSALYCYSDSLRRWLLLGMQNQQNECEDASKSSVFASLSSKTILWIKNTVGNSRMFV